MSRVWLRQLARKFLAGQQLQEVSKRPAVRLRLEALEDRTVPTTLQLASNGITSSAMSDGSGIGLGFRTVAESAIYENRNASMFTGRAEIHATGLDALLADVRLMWRGVGGGKITGTANGPPPSAIYFSTVVTPSWTIDGPNLVSFTARAPGYSPTVELTRTTAPAAGVPTGGPVEAGLSFVVRAQGGIAGSDSAARDASAPDTGFIPLAPSPATVSVLARRVQATGAWTATSEDAGNVAEVETNGTRPDVYVVYVAPSSRGNGVGAYAAGAGIAGVIHLVRSEGEAPGQAAGRNGDTLAEELSDSVLLQRFVTHQDQMAFTALVQRHQQFVLGICQRVLGDPHAAEDAVQATFLVLARKASMLDGQNPLAGWLYKVAYHLALRVRAVNARTRKREKGGLSERCCRFAGVSSVDLEQQEMRRLLYAELQSLPDKYRVPLVLCYLDGQTHAQAAREIGMPRGSIAKRIGEALGVLRERLIERGLIF